MLTDMTGLIQNINGLKILWSMVVNTGEKFPTSRPPPFDPLINVTFWKSHSFSKLAVNGFSGMKATGVLDSV